MSLRSEFAIAKLGGSLLSLWVLGGLSAAGLFADISIERLLEDRAVRLVITGEKGDTWAIEFSDDLKVWMGLSEAGLVVLDESGRGEFVITPTSDAQFYRSFLSSKASSQPVERVPLSEESQSNQSQLASR